MSYDPQLKLLKHSAKEYAKSYLIASILAITGILIVPDWIKWSLLYTISVILLCVGIANILDNWKPRELIEPNGKAVFITGCDTGFGHMLAKTLNEEGFEVFAGCLFPDGDGAKELKRICTKSMHVIPLDVTSDSSVRKAYEYVTHNLNDKGLWAVVNNAGINDGGEVLWTSMEIIEKVVQVNTLGVIRVTKEFLPLLCQSKGRLVCVSSMAGKYPFHFIAPYAASKNAVSAFCDSLRLEMYKFGVKVVTVEPYGFRTALTDESRVIPYLRKAWDRNSYQLKDLLPRDYLEKEVIFTFKRFNFILSDVLQEVVICLKLAVMAENPKCSYTPGSIILRILFSFSRLLPRVINDFIIMMLFKFL